MSRYKTARERTQMLLNDIANKIRERREKLGLKQQDIANALNVSPQAVSRWERGENAPDIGTLVPLARLLDVSVDWLLSANDPDADVFEATVFVSSVRGAYARSVKLAPRDFALWANGLFFQLTEMTLRFEGVPLKYLGDKYLCFFAGQGHRGRALRAAAQAKAIVDEDIKIGLCSGTVYLGTIGHPDYARPDLMGEVVNTAFLLVDWAEQDAGSGIAAAESVRCNGEAPVRFDVREDAKLTGVSSEVVILEVTPV